MPDMIPAFFTIVKLIAPAKTWHQLAFNPNIIKKPGVKWMQKINKLH